MEIQVPANFNPRSYQREFFSAWPSCKRFQLVWARRSGKDKSSLVFLLLRALERVGTYWYLFPERQQAEKNLWDNIDNDGFKTMNHIPKELIRSVHKTQLKVTLKNGSIIQLLGTQDLDKLVGGNPVGVVISEYSLVDPRILTQVLGPILAANNGWLVLNYTPRGRNWAYDLWNATAQDPAWYRSLLTVDQTRKDAPGKDGSPVTTREYIESERTKGVPEEMIQQEYFCSFNGVTTGAIYADQVQLAIAEGRVTDVPWDQRKIISTAWDLGVADATVVLFFYVTDGGQVAIFDMIEEKGKGLDYFIREVLNKKYIYSRDSHWAPHDLFRREPVQGKSMPEIARGLGIDFQMTPQVSVQEGISYARGIFGRCLFDRTRCARLVTCLTDYHRHYDEKRMVYSDIPEHGWSSDCADAFRYLSLVWDLSNPNRMQPYPDASGTRDSVWSAGEQDDESRPVPSPGRYRHTRDSGWMKINPSTGGWEPR